LRLTHSTDYRPDIDGLRAIAVIAVVGFHAFPEIFPGGFVGVDVFFVISGYLITAILISEIETGRFSLLRFYERRARRILPALALVIVACLPLAWWLLPPTEMRQFGESAIATALFVSNIFFWNQSGYFDSAAELKPLLHTWSLAVEEQFYILFPITLAFLMKAGRQRATMALVGLAGLSFLLSVSLVKEQPSAAFFLLPTRAWELLLGSVCAFGLPAGAHLRSRMAPAGAWLGLALVTLSVFMLDRSTPTPGWPILLPTVGAALIVCCGGARGMVGDLLGGRLLVSIGLVSYSLYLWHQPLLVFFRISGFQDVPLAHLWLFAVLGTLSYLSWRFVEIPFRSSTTLSTKGALVPTAAAFTAVVCFGITSSATHGFTERTRFAAQALLDAPVTRFTPCEPQMLDEAPTLRYCYGTDPSPTALVIGDSHADDKFVGIQRALPEFKWRMLGNHSCPPLYRTSFTASDGTECTARMAKIFDYVAASPDVKLVVLAFSHAYALDSYVAAGHISKGLDPSTVKIEVQEMPGLAKDKAFYQGLSQTVDFLSDRGIRSVVLIDVPELPFFPLACVNSPASCKQPREDVAERQMLIRAQLQILADRYPASATFDPLPIFCDQKSCSALKDGRSLYRDSDHLGLYGSLVFGEAFARWYRASPTISATP